MSEWLNSDNDDFDGSISVEDEVEVVKPPLYKVILHNDDYTTMEFVIAILCKYFNKNEEEAVKIMYDVHKSGAGLAGIFTKEIAETRVAGVHKKARDAGFPLLCTMERE